MTEKFAIWRLNKKTCSLLRCLLSYQMIQRDLSDILAQIHQPSNAKPCNFDLVSKWLLQHSSTLLQCCIRGVTSVFVDPVEVGYAMFFNILKTFTQLDPSPNNAPGPPCRQPCQYQAKHVFHQLPCRQENCFMNRNRLMYGSYIHI